MPGLILSIAHNNDGQDVAEYAVMLAVLCCVVIASLVLIGQNANAVFSLAAATLSKLAAAS